MVSFGQVKMGIEILLSKLDGVKSKGRNRWMAKCCVHIDRTPSLSIKDDNGTILIKCFGCGASGVDVANTLGIEITELFPPSEKFDASQPAQKRQFYDSAQVLEGLAYEALVMHIIGNDMLKNGSIEPDERDRLAQASCRINAALEYIKRIIK